MDKSELRKARKEARARGEKLVGILAIVPNKTASNKTKNRKASRIRAEKRLADKINAGLDKEEK